MDSKTKTVGDVLSEINALENAYKDLTDLINALNKERNKLDLPFDSALFLIDIRTRLEKNKDALKYQLNSTEVASDLFAIIK